MVEVHFGFRFVLAPGDFSIGDGQKDQKPKPKSQADIRQLVVAVVEEATGGKLSARTNRNFSREGERSVQTSLVCSA
jgi:hypothetical protein